MNAPEQTEPETGLVPLPASALDRLRAGDSKRWTNIADAQALSRSKAEALAKVAQNLLPTDEGALVVFGSLARGEYTADSDLDWTVIIDGQADSDHLKIVQSLRPRLGDADFKVPGPTEVFGGLVFSHELIHAIGGDEDTNKNMTRRLLLLLESAPIDVSSSKIVHSRIINGILNRYVEEDANFIAANQRKNKIPRFLLNDAVRFWRTMAVDYANKYRVRGSQKWALRNIKLRMSRKLLFVSGFFMCISWALQNPDPSDGPYITKRLVSHLRDWTQRPPLESLAAMVELYDASLADEIFGSYDAFLSLLNNRELRTLLETLTPDEAYSDPVFLAAREQAYRFDSALTKLMFDADPRVTDLVKKYGVF